MCPKIGQTFVKVIKNLINMATETKRVKTKICCLDLDKVCYNNRFATLAYWIFTLVGTGGPALWHRPFPDR